MFILISENDDYESDRSICYIWEEKPTVLDIASLLNIDLGVCSEEEVLGVVDLARGNMVKSLKGADLYSIEEFEFLKKYGRLNVKQLMQNQRK